MYTSGYRKLANRHLFEALLAKARDRAPGPPDTFNSHEELLEAAAAYFEFVRDNDMEGEKIFQYQGEVIRATTYRPRNLSLRSLCAWLGIGVPAWKNWQNASHTDYRPDLAPTCQLLEAAIDDYVLTHASAELINPTIATRQLGLRDHIETVNHAPAAARKELTEEELVDELKARGLPTSIFTFEPKGDD